MIYQELRETKPENAPSADSTIAFDKAASYDDMLESLIGLRNSAWANAHKDIFSAKVITYITNALLNKDHELLRLLQIPLVEMNTVEIIKSE